MTKGSTEGSPYAPHDPDERARMLAAVGAEDEADLFDVPEPVSFDGEFGISARSERETVDHVGRLLDGNDDLTELLGRGHHAHYVPSLVDDLAGRSEFLTAYTQYQPEVAQGFLQALFEYQSLLVDLTGLDVANCSTYDAATALGEAARMAARVGAGSRVLVPDLLRDETRRVLSNYAAGADLTVETYPTSDANVDLAGLGAALDDDAALVYAASPTVRGTLEERLGAVGDLADDHEALFCLGSDPVALALLEEPAAVGADVVVGDAASLGTGRAGGMGLGLFVTRERYLREVPGRIVGATTDDTGRRAYTLTLQTREQHIRRERATSNVCTNQAWLALRAAIHAAWLGPDGLLALAESSVTRARDLAARLDDLSGLRAPVHDRHHFREFVARTDQPAAAVRDALADRGYAVHAVDEHAIQVSATAVEESALDGFVDAVREVA